MPKPANVTLVTLQHDEFGRVIVDEAVVEQYREKGWRIEGEEEEKPGDPAPSSANETVSEAVVVIAALDTPEEVETYAGADERKGVQLAVAARLDELHKPDESGEGNEE